jgi:hypothetical protein
VNTADYTAFRRLEETVRAAAERHGFSHFDLFADSPLGTLREELIALHLYVEIPVRIGRGNTELAHQLCQAAVMSGQWSQQHAPKTAPQPAGHPAIARANRAALARRVKQWGSRA